MEGFLYAQKHKLTVRRSVLLAAPEGTAAKSTHSSSPTRTEDREGSRQREDVSLTLSNGLHSKAELGGSREVEDTP